MAKKTKPDSAAAVIDIGSSELRLKIAQRGKTRIKYLESITYGLSLGRDTFDTGKISFEKTDKVCGVIKNFLTAAAGYGITDVRDVKVVATTAVREATNREYVLDQIKIKTGASVRIFDDMEEKMHIYRMMTHLMDDEMKSSAMLVYSGSGNVGISLMTDGRMPYVRNIRTGSLRISEIFYEVQEYSAEFSQVVDEYLGGFIENLAPDIPNDTLHFIASGHELSLIAQLCGCKDDRLLTRIPKAKFQELYNDLKPKTVERIAKDCNITVEKADLLLPAMIICHNLMKMTKADEIICPMVFLSDALLFQALYPDENDALIREYNKHTLTSARTLAGRFNVSEGHCRSVESFALKIFDKMKKIHGLDTREKLLLQVAAILHDAGKYINVRGHNTHSYQIVLGSDIVGLSSLENRLVANLCLYHGRLTPTLQDESYRALRPRERVLVSKLTAILRLADALDRSNSRKFDEIDVKIADGKLIITLETNKNVDLEIWSFNRKSRFFMEVFGIQAVLKKKRS